MSKLPEENEELPPLLEAFQQLKYDPEQNTNEGIYLISLFLTFKFTPFIFVNVYRACSGTQRRWKFQF